MSNQTINGKIKHRLDTSANWTSANPVLLAGEMGIESDTHKFKFGDGVTAWTSLSYGMASASVSLAELGITATLEELNCIDGVTSAIQPQLDTKMQNFTVADGVSLNTLVTSGVYRLNASHGNAPANASWSQLLVAHAGGDTIFQIVIPHAADSLYYRSGNPMDVGGSGSWRAWKELSPKADPPGGGIIMFTGSFGGSDGKRPIDTITGVANESWVKCDGTNGTPNLMDRFVVGAGSSYAIGATGGENSHTLSWNEMPVHNHYVGSKPNMGDVYWDNINGTANSFSSKSFKASDSTYTVGYPNTSNAGAGWAHENRPPFYALAFIKRIS